MEKSLFFTHNLAKPISPFMPLCSDMIINGNYYYMISRCEWLGQSVFILLFFFFVHESLLCVHQRLTYIMVP